MEKEANASSSRKSSYLKMKARKISTKDSTKALIIDAKRRKFSKNEIDQILPGKGRKNKELIEPSNAVDGEFRNEGAAVQKLGRNKSSEFLLQLTKKYENDVKITLAALKDLILEKLTDGGDDFKRFFVIFSLSSFLTPRSNRLVDWSAIECVVEVGQITKYDWCSYILNHLCKAIAKFNSSSKKNISGCVMLLQIIYFHRLKWKGKAAPCTLPLIQHWTNDKIWNRIKEETAAGSYGQGELILDTYPVSVKVGRESENNGEEKDRERSVEKTEEEETTDGVHVSSRSITFKLPDDEPDNLEIHKMAKDNMRETFLLLKRDVSVVFNYHMKSLSKMKKKLKSSILEVLLNH